ncbi:MAG: sulfatase-like hydrolase/transferase [Planctomycetota bacterium]|nr:sulfatase-like hydrolase/transferase [Planctomycetota bacterium]
MLRTTASLLCLSVVVGLACALPRTGEEPAPQVDRPNILFILADDQSPFDLPVYDPASRLNAPVLAQLAADGMTIDGAYHMGSWSGAVCTPSRHMVMSGRTVWHLPRNGIKGVQHNPLCPEDLPEHTLAAVFNRAGYDTMRTCKKGNSYAAANAQFTVVRDATMRKASAEEGSAWHAQQVLDYLAEREASGDEDPFFIYLGFSHPHDPRWASEELLAHYGAVNELDTLNPNPDAPPLPANWLPAHPFHDGQPGLRDEVNVQGVKQRRDPATIRNEIGRQLACSENIDIQIGRVLAKLDATGELASTYVIYSADHGMAIGRHGLQGKQNLYEHTWRVPLIVKGPGIAAGTRAQGNVYLLDLLATFCDLSGVEAPATNEGSSFAPVLRGERETIRDVLYGVYAGGTKPGMRCVRKGDWKLIKYDALDGRVRETQLFNLAENPSEFLPQHYVAPVVALTGVAPTREQTDLAEDPRYAVKLAEMEALLLSEMLRLDDPYRLWDQEE